MSAQGRDYVEKRYDAAIGYYWHVGSRNKRAYKWSRYLIIVLGSAVTLVASLSSAEFLKDHATLFAILTPVLAALLTMLSAFSQSFQWGASWREMVLAAERLQGERDRIAVTPDDAVDPLTDLAVLNQLVLRESAGFFDRVMGSSVTMPASENGGPQTPARGALAPEPKPAIE